MASSGTSDMDKVKTRITAVEDELVNVKATLGAATEKLCAATEKEDIAYWRKREGQLDERLNTLLKLLLQENQSASDSDGPSPKRVKLASVALAAQQPLDLSEGVGRFVDVKQKKLAGFSVDECRLYVRQETVGLWKMLETTTASNRNLSVDGPPGTGKSTEVWAWALWKAVENKQKVTWFHFSKKAAIKVVIDGVAMTISSGYSAEIVDINRSDGSILVVDGLTKADSVNINRGCSAWRHQGKLQGESRCFVVVSSVSVTVALEQDREAEIETFTVGSWSLKQYEDACMDDTLYAEVKSKLVVDGDAEIALGREELILSKYRFAGGCARWMFEFGYVDWLKDFNGHLAKIGSYKNIFTEGGGDEAVMAANHLRGVSIVETVAGREKKYFFISEYAAMELGKKCDDKRKFLISSYEKADEVDNPSFRGWIFEFDVDYQLQEAARTAAKELGVTIRPTNVSEQWKVDKYITFSTVPSLAAEIKQFELEATQSELWAKPAKWNQAAYDFLCFQKVKGTLHMKAVNATGGGKHKVLLDVVNLLGKELGKELETSGYVVGAIRFDFIVPKGAAFQVGDVRGNLVGWKNPQNAAWAKQISDVSGFIVIADLVTTAPL